MLFLRTRRIAALWLTLLMPLPAFATGDPNDTGDGGTGPGTQNAQQNFFRDEYTVDVDPSSGAFQTSVAIQVPAYRGIEPRISLQYSSSGGNGFAGVGWRLAGISKIERISAGGGAPRYDSNDVYALDGQELVGSCTLLGGTHCPRIQSYERIQQQGSNWIVTEKNGTRRTYTPLISEGSNTFRWALSTVTDTHGNTVSYSYTCPSSSEDCYPNTIQYNGAMITFARESRTDDVVIATGKNLRTSDERLWEIRVSAGSQARRYRLNYMPSQNGARSKLMNVQLLRLTTAGEQVFPADLSFTYQDGTTPSFDRTTYSNQEIRPQYEWLTGDFNGDGLTDVFGIPNGGRTAYTFLASVLSNGDVAYTRDETDVAPDYPAIVPTNQGHWFSGDIDGNGLTDIVHAQNTIFFVWFADGNGSFDIQQGSGSCLNCAVIPQDYSSGRWMSGDFNGDGDADMAWASRVSRKLYIWLSNGDEDFQVREIDPGLANITAGSLLPVDLNGDGNTDLVHVHANRLYWYVSDGSGDFVRDDLGKPGGYPSDLHAGRWRAGDFNGDGNTDLFHATGTTGNLRVWYSHGGDGFSQVPITVPGGYPSTLTGWWFVTNQNGDGRSDLLHVSTIDPLGEHTLRFWESEDEPGSFAHSNQGKPSGYPGTNNTWAGGKWQIGDVNGDSQDDLLHFPVVIQNDDELRTWRSIGQAGNRLTSVTNRTGGTTTVAYDPSTVWPTTGFLPVGMVMHTVSSITTDDGLGNTHPVSYEYAGALWSKRERCFLGFGIIRKYLEGVSPGNHEETRIRQVDNCTNRPEFIYKRDGLNRIFSYTELVYDEQVTTPPYSALEQERRQHECNQINTTGNNCREIRTDTFYDTYANVTRTVAYGELGLPVSQRTERTTLRDYAYNVPAYLVDRASRERIYEGVTTTGSGLTPAAETQLLYDGNGVHTDTPGVGDLTTRRRWDDFNSAYRVTELEYDGDGNLLREFDEEGRGRRMEYDATFNIFPVVTCDDPVLPPATPLIPCRMTDWDTVLGVPIDEWDPNSELTHHDYDDFGRRTKTTLPDLSERKVFYSGEGNPGAQKIQVQEPDPTVDGIYTDRFIDGFGREWKMVREGGATKLTEYHENTDRIARESVVHDPAEGAQYRAFAYDGAKRLIQVTEPYQNPQGGGSVFSTVTYNNSNDGSVTRTDTLGNVRTTFKDGLGRTRQVRERENSVNLDTFFDYSILDNLIQVTDSAPTPNVATFAYDSLSQKRSSCDFDIDQTTCVQLGYDFGGLVTSQTNARVQQIVRTHDVLGRVTTKNSLADGELTQWFYDEPGFGVSLGRLTRVTYPGGSQSFTWDNMGLQTDITRCVAADCRSVGQTFVDGRLATLTYPDTETLTYSYDDEGFLDSVTPNLVDDLDFDARGKLTSMAYANGVVAGQTYRYPQDVIETASVGLAPATDDIYRATYAYDAASQIASITSTTHDKLNVSFTYDDLYRLKNVDPTEAGKGQTQSFAYDSIGNMTTRDGLTYTYGDTTRPHAVTNADGRDYTYGPDGNLLSVTTRTPTCITIDRLHSYDAEGRMRWASDGSVTTAYRYDHEGQRIEKRGPGGTTYYYGDLFEVSDPEGSAGLVKYYYAAGLLVAREEAAAKQYVHQDHLGSIRALTAETTGALGVAYEYAAFGEQIETFGGTSTNTRAYGAHWRDDESGLLYMGARYHDPALSRFTQPDPVVPDPQDPQSWNRYSFLRNNPINRIDPTGRQDEEAQEDGGQGDGSVGGVPEESEGGFFAGLANAGPQVLGEAGADFSAIQNFNPVKFGVGAVNTVRGLAGLAAGTVTLGTSAGASTVVGPLALPGTVVGTAQLAFGAANVSRGSQQVRESFNDPAGPSARNLLGLLPFGQEFDDPVEPRPQDFVAQRLRGLTTSPGATGRRLLKEFFAFGSNDSGAGP